MTRAFRIMWAGCTLAMIVGSSSVRADGGSISFSGAVVEPTCSVSDASVLATAMPRPNLATSPQRFTCGRTDTSANAGRAYSLTEVSLDAAAIGNDRVLTYFAGYLSAAGIAEAKLVTQTFE
jgi:type 1 fimbria pilin